MRDRTVTRVETWDARPFSGGFAGLRELADGNFSGVVVSGGTWLFMLNGRVVGIVDGDIDDFEDATGTLHEAPDPALPLLFSMQERGGTTQAKYYTNDTPLEEADRTLSDANFTGFVELSENVLSGDYYLVYYGGRMLPVAFVGTSDELKTGDEAYDLAVDEVGVYEVIKTPVNVTQIPGPSGGSEAADDAEPTGGVTTAEPTPDPEAASNDPASTPVETAGDADTGTPVDADSTPATTSSDPVSTTEERPPSTPDPVTEAEPAAADTSPAESSPSTSKSPTSEASAAAGDEARQVGTEATRGDQDAADTDESSVFSEEEQWRQTRSIPSLSPSEREKRIREGKPVGARGSAAGSAQQASSTEVERSQSGARQATPSEQSPSTSSATQTTSEPSSTAGAEGPSEASTPSESADRAAPAAGTDESTAALTAEVESLQARLEELGGERDDLSAELSSVREERDELKRRVSQLESALEEAGGEAAPGPALTPDEALAGTNLFVRYGSKGQPTLDDLTTKNPDPEAINTNLRIDHHTQFESTDATVDGVPFKQFLEGSSAFRFVSWLVRDLPYEVLDAGHRGGLGDLYDVIPAVDRVELRGTVDVELEDGSDRRDFDVVLRDRMGNPLVVADLNDSRDPVTGDQMESLVEAARVVGEGEDHLGAAFYVTASFFEPDALENAGEATANGGILSRSDRMSYVKLARKRGFHLCLAEDRNETFHLTVPEL